MGIYFGNYKFSDPIPVLTWPAPYRAGVYGILASDLQASSQQFRVIYFGESGNMSERGFLRSHQKHNCWIKEAGSPNNLYICVFPMPNSTHKQRQIVESTLISLYNPICN
jgi:hypothetical protein